MAGKLCRVSFRDLEGVRHEAEVQADSLYEAAVLGLNTLKKSDWVDAVGPGTRIEIAVHEPPVAHFLMVGQLRSWLDGGGKSPAEVAKKKKLKQLLAG